MIDLKINKYNIDNKTVESCFIFEIKNLNNNNNLIYNLKLPSNPLVDIEILELQELSFEDKITKLKMLVKKKEFSYKTSESINKFILWIEEILQNCLELHNIR